MRAFIVNNVMDITVNRQAQLLLRPHLPLQSYHLSGRTFPSTSPFCPTQIFYTVPYLQNYHPHKFLWWYVLLDSNLSATSLTNARITSYELNRVCPIPFYKCCNKNFQMYLHDLTCYLITKVFPIRLRPLFSIPAFH